MPKHIRTILLGLSMAVVGLGFGYAIGKLLKGQKADLHFGPWILPIVFLDLWLVLAWHELGHAIGGWLAGFQLHLFAAGPLRIDRQGDRFEWKLNRSASLWGGIAASSPSPLAIPKADVLRQKMLLLVVGGPLASLLGGLAYFPSQLFWPASPYIAAAFMIFAITSLCIFIVTMVPISNAGFVNDGARILNLLRRDEAGLRWVSSATLGALSLQVRPREWPFELIEQTTRDVQPSYDGIMAMWMRFSWHLDRKEIPEAKTWLERGLSHVNDWPAAARPILHSSAADFYSRIEPDLPRARRHLSEASKPGFVPTDSLAITEASVLMAEGNHSAAREKIFQGRQILSTLTGTSRESLKEILDQLEAKAH